MLRQPPLRPALVLGKEMPAWRPLSVHYALLLRAALAGTLTFAFTLFGCLALGQILSQLSVHLH